MIETFQHKQLTYLLFIYGPTSCGKTLTAKSLAKYLNYHYLKLDMNQYQESHSLYKLLETYHEQPSLLLSTLQSYPHTVLLLDHIDQACEEIIHLFSQIQRMQKFENSNPSQTETSDNIKKRYNKKTQKKSTNEEKKQTKKANNI